MTAIFVPAVVTSFSFLLSYNKNSRKVVNRHQCENRRSVFVSPEDLSVKALCYFLARIQWSHVSNFPLRQRNAVSCKRDGAKLVVANIRKNMPTGSFVASKVKYVACPRPTANLNLLMLTHAAIEWEWTCFQLKRVFPFVVVLQFVHSSRHRLKTKYKKFIELNTFMNSVLFPVKNSFYKTRIRRK